MTKTEQVQDIFNLNVDDIWGPATDAAVAAEKAASLARHAKPAPARPSVIVADGEKVDERSERAIKTLLPKVQPLARELVRKLTAAGINAKIISGSRTYAEQNALYEQGRSKPGPVVTNARGGQSWHNFGVAVDIGIFDNGKYLGNSPLYKKAGAIGRELGFEWGGDWKGSLVDEPHFQYNPNRLSLSLARAFQEQGKDIA